MDRFLTVDSGGADLKNPQSFNRYAYASNDPINGYDPTGRLTVCLDSGFGSINDASNPCAFGTAIDTWPFAPVRTVAESDDISGNDISSRANALQAAGVIDDWTVGNRFGTAATVTIDSSWYLALVGNGFLQANPVLIDEAERGLQEVLTVGTATIAAVIAWIQHYRSQTSWMAGSFPTVQEIQTRCTPVGKPVTVPSTNTRNKGGQSIEQEYLCPDGSRYTIHTLVDKNGKIIDQHARPGSPKMGTKHYDTKRTRAKVCLE
jgi:hypothetical protein